MSQAVLNGLHEVPKRILVIEDDAVVARLYQNRLRREGFTVDLATEGQEGFYSIIEAKPDGVLLDLMLPNMDGVSILKKLRAQKQFETLPIIVFSNSFINGMLDEAMAAGATKVFNKSDPHTTQNIVAGFMEAFYPTRYRQQAGPQQLEIVAKVDPAVLAASGGTLVVQNRPEPIPQAPAPAPRKPIAPRFGAIPTKPGLVFRFNPDKEVRDKQKNN